MWLEPDSCERRVEYRAAHRRKTKNVLTRDQYEVGAKERMHGRQAGTQSAIFAVFKGRRRSSAPVGLFISRQQSLLDQLPGVLVDHLGVLVEKVRDDGDRALTGRILGEEVGLHQGSEQGKRLDHSGEQARIDGPFFLLATAHRALQQVGPVHQVLLELHYAADVGTDHERIVRLLFREALVGVLALLLFDSVLQPYPVAFLRLLRSAAGESSAGRQD